MQARLTGRGFEIEAISPEEQVIDPAGTTEWKWAITPTQAGEQDLHLTLSALIEVEEQPTPRLMRSFDRTITVNVTLGQRAKRFITGNWQWLWTAVLVPIGLFIYSRYKKNTAQRGGGGHPRVR